MTQAATARRQCLTRLAQLAQRELGIRMPPNKLTMLEARIERRMRTLGVPTLEAYEQHLLKVGPQGELTHFVDAVTTNTTEFFRERVQFDLLVEQVHAQLRGRKSDLTLNVWCAGCSTGQEAYTLAMVLSELAREDPRLRFSILATDVSSRVLKEAQRAVYDEQLVEPIPLGLRKRYLMRSKDSARGLVRIAPELRAHVRFKQLNFMDERYPLTETFDVVFFRNVLIYFDRREQALIVRRQCEHLRSGGQLFIGRSESLSGLDLPIEQVAQSVYRKVP